MNYVALIIYFFLILRANVILKYIIMVISSYMLTLGVLF